MSEKMKDHAHKTQLQINQISPLI
jgi:hypothetical protein